MVGVETDPDVVGLAVSRLELPVPPPRADADRRDAVGLLDFGADVDPVGNKIVAVDNELELLNGMLVVVQVGLSRFAHPAPLAFFASRGLLLAGHFLGVELV